MELLFADRIAALPPAGERILAAASTLFYENGIRAVGVDTIAEAAATTKKTLYDRFGSKDALVAAYLVRRAQRWQTHLETVVARRRPGRGRALGVFDALESWIDPARGCAFINAYAEYGGSTHPVVDVIRAEKAWMRDYFVDQVRQGGYPAPQRLGATLHLLYEGGLVTSTAGADPQAISSARQAAAGLLKR